MLAPPRALPSAETADGVACTCPRAQLGCKPSLALLSARRGCFDAVCPSGASCPGDLGTFYAASRRRHFGCCHENPY